MMDNAKPEATTTAATPDLLPCPFCGTTPKKFDASASHVWCRGCNADGPLSTDAIAAWNHRAPPAARTEVSAAARDILAERQRQIAIEGWTPEHDDQHSGGEMAAAAAAYAFSAATADRYFALDPLGFWPWSPDWWKPTTPRRDLVKAGALILAEFERLDRAALERKEGET